MLAVQGNVKKADPQRKRGVLVRLALFAVFRKVEVFHQEAFQYRKEVLAPILAGIGQDRRLIEILLPKPR